MLHFQDIWRSENLFWGTMNLILINCNETFFLKNDERYGHIKNILKLKMGDIFKAGIIDGNIGEAEILFFDEAVIKFNFISKCDKKELHPITIVCGLVRPIQIKRILKIIATLGIEKILFFHSDTGEKSYANSTLWENYNYKKYLIDGAQQGALTSLPKVELHSSLDSVLDKNRLKNIICFDKSDISKKFSSIDTAFPITLFIGSERGWSDRELNILRERGAQFTSIGDRILKTETAIPVAISLILYKLNLL